MTRTLQAGKPIEARWANAIRRAERTGVEARQVAGTGQWVVPSASDPTKAYMLAVGNGEVVSCTCPAIQEWGHGVCVHMAALRLKLDPGFAAQPQRAAGQAELFEGAA